MANQFNNQRCSKCYSKYSGLGEAGYSSHCGHEHFFKKNGQLFCINCLMAEGHVKYSKCRKLISCYDDLGDWRRNVVLLGDHTADANFFGCNCRKCSAEIGAENKPKPTEKSQERICKSPGCSNIVSVDFSYNNKGLCTSCGRKNDEEQTAQSKDGEQIFKKYKQVIEKAQSWWNSLSSEERQKEIRSLEVRLPAQIKKFWNSRGYTTDGNQIQSNAGYSHWDTFENGKLSQSDPTRVPWAIVDEFFSGKLNSDNNSLPSTDNSNSPAVQPPQSENNEQSKEKVEIVNNGASNGDSDKNDSEVLTINVKNNKNIKKVTLIGGNLVIEFNKSEKNNDKLATQTITAEQVNSNQELQTIKNYCQKSGKSSLSQKDLNNIFSTHSTLGSVSKPTGNNNNALVIGLSIPLP